MKHYKLLRSIFGFPKDLSNLLLILLSRHMGIALRLQKRDKSLFELGFGEFHYLI